MTTGNDNPRVALISMPTLAAHFPSFQLGLLKPTLEREGIHVQPYSLFLYFGSHIGWKLNDSLAAVRPCLAGEWVWSKAAFGDFADESAYIERFRSSLDDICSAADCTIEDLLEVRNKKTFSFLDFMLETVDWSRFQLFGFSVVFQQMTSSLAFARRLKEKYPQTPIIFGGATFENDIAEGILEATPWIDYIHCGDADETFPEFVRRLVKHEKMDGLPGIMWRNGTGETHFNGRSPNLANLDKTPIPDFDEYFYARRESGYERSGFADDPLIPIETARGCWWGMKQHCTFCGLNRSGMNFRAKSVDNVMEMLQTLARRYNRLYFDAIDNIMATEYIDELFGRLAESHTDIKIHYEVRPYLSREQLRNLRLGGLFSVQPGIESLSTNVLTIMRKHSTGVRNLAFMKWCTYYGIDNLYNILYGFPGETLEDYQLQMELLKKIPHFQPPYGYAKARADRGSPMYTEAQQHKVNNLRPSPCYPFIYPPDKYDLQKVSYYFDHDQGDILDDEPYHRLWVMVRDWKQRWRQQRKPTLKYYKSVNTLHIEDNRNGAPRRFLYADKAADLYEYCNDPRSLSSIQRRFEGDDEGVKRVLDQFVEYDLMVYLDDRYLSLALPANQNL